MYETPSIPKCFQNKNHAQTVWTICFHHGLWIHLPITSYKVSKGVKMVNRCNQVPHLTQDTDGKATSSQPDTTTRMHKEGRLVKAQVKLNCVLFSHLIAVHICTVRSRKFEVLWTGGFISNYQYFEKLAGSYKICNPKIYFYHFFFL